MAERGKEDGMKEENDGEMRRREDADGSMFDQQRGAEDGEVKLNHRREKKNILLVLQEGKLVVQTLIISFTSPS